MHLSETLKGNEKKGMKNWCKIPPWKKRGKARLKDHLWPKHEPEGKFRNWSEICALFSEAVLSCHCDPNILLHPVGSIFSNPSSSCDSLHLHRPLFCKYLGVWVQLHFQNVSSENCIFRQTLCHGSCKQMMVEANNGVTEIKQFLFQLKAKVWLSFFFPKSLQHSFEP